MSVGIELVDEQHKMLIQHLNNLIRAVEQHQGPEKISETLGFLIDYTDFHFSAEERHMAANEYHNLDAHKSLHNEFKTTLGNLEADYLEEGPTHELASSIDTLLINWLIKHIQSVDVEFGAFLKDKGIEIPHEG